MSETETTEAPEVESPASPEEAWDRAMAALTAEQRMEYGQRRSNAIAGGMPIPPPPGYAPPAAQPATEMDAALDTADQAEGEASRITQLEEQIRQAQTDGDWSKSFALKSNYTDLVNQRRRSAVDGGGTFHGVDG